MIRNDQCALTAISLAAFVGLAGLGGVDIAILLIAEYFNTTPGTISWVISSSMLVLIGFCVIADRASGL